MIRVAATVIVLLVAAGICADGQTPTVAVDQQYLFIDTSRISRLRERLIEAGKQGYGVQFAARVQSSLALVLKRDNAGPRIYRLVTAYRETTFVKELNEAGSQGFRLVPVGTKIAKNEWLAVFAQQPNGARFTYSVVKGNEDEGAKALAEAKMRGAVLAAVLSDKPTFNPKPMLIFEEVHGVAPAGLVSGERDYRVVATLNTRTLEKEIKQAATEGFRAIASAFMTVVMERDPGSPPAPVDYHLVAMQRVATAEHELQAAGAEGFRIAVVPESTDEGVFVLQRTPGTSERFDYRLARLKEETANELLLRAEADGYRIAVLFSDLVVLERPLPR